VTIDLAKSYNIKNIFIYNNNKSKLITNLYMELLKTITDCDNINSVVYVYNNYFPLFYYCYYYISVNHYWELFLIFQIPI